MRIIAESVYNTIPVSGNPYNLRMTGESLDFTRTKESDKEIRDDRQLSTTTTVDAQAAGDIKVHVQYAEYDRLFAAVLQDTWTVFGTNGVGTTFTADYTATTITASVATSGSSIFTSLQKGQWFRLLAPSTANDGKLLRVSSSVAPTTTVITLDANTPATVATATALCVIQTSRLTNGVTMPSFTLERGMSDINQFMAYRGMCVSKFATQFSAGALNDGTFSFMGSGFTRNTATNLPGTPVVSQTYNITNGVTGVGNIWAGGAPLTDSIKSMTIDIDNTLRGQKAIGTLGNVNIGVGTFMVKGTMEVYFANGTLYDQFANDTFTSVNLSVQDTSGNGYVLTFPRVMLTAAKVQAGSKDADLMASFEYTAYADLANATTALRKTMFMDRVGVAVLP
jgi:hypothetical protein